MISPTDMSRKKMTASNKFATWVSWIEKGGLFLNVALFRGRWYTESVDGKQQKGFYVVTYSDEPYLEMVIFLFVPSVLV